MRLLRKFGVSSWSDAYTSKQNVAEQVTEQVTEQMTMHLTHLLNTTKDYGAFEHEFGLSRCSGELYSELGTQRLQEQIKQNVQAWETRFQLAEVQIIRQAPRWLFRLIGQVGDQPLSLDFYSEPSL